MDADRRAHAEAVVGHRFADSSLLEEALTHPSATGQRPDREGYDRLEFLGDAVLGFLISEHVFRRLPDAREGELTVRKHRAVSGETLAAVAEDLGLASLVELGKGAQTTGGRARASMLENVFEALVGALYLDGGLEAAASFAVRILESRYATEDVPDSDAKSFLQQYTQSRTGLLPEYRITHVVGPPHSRTFSSEVTLDGRRVPRGISPVPIGSYDVAVRAFGYSQWNGRIVVRENAVSSISVDLAPTPFAIRTPALTRAVVNPENPGLLGSVEVRFDVTGPGSGTATIFWAHQPALRPDAPRSDATLHPASVPRGPGFRLDRMGWSVLDARGSAAASGRWPPA